MSVPPTERLLERIRAEYLEMPGLCLTPEQIQRLCGVERTICQLVLDSLVDAKVPVPEGERCLHGCQTERLLGHGQPRRA